MMLTMEDYKRERGITEDDMRAARERGRAYEDAYNLREARKERHMTQVDVAGGRKVQV